MQSISNRIPVTKEGNQVETIIHPNGDVTSFIPSDSIEFTNTSDYNIAGIIYYYNDEV